MDGNQLKTYKRIITLIKVDDKVKKSRFLENPFLLAKIGIDIAFRMCFLIWSVVKVNFNNWEPR